jgi:predicted transcriptional regulator
MAHFVYDTSQEGLRTVFKDYQEEALRVLWESETPLGSREICERVNARLGGGSISRASVINFLDDMKKMGVLKGIERTGKGGHQWVYSPAMNEAEFKEFVASTIISNLMRDFPEETTATISKIAN